MSAWGDFIHRTCDPNSAFTPANTRIQAVYVGGCHREPRTPGCGRTSVANAHDLTDRPLCAVVVQGGDDIAGGVVVDVVGQPGSAGDLDQVLLGECSALLLGVLARRCLGGVGRQTVDRVEAGVLVLVPGHLGGAVGDVRFQTLDGAHLRPVFTGIHLR